MPALIRDFSPADRDALRQIYLAARQQAFTWLDGSSLQLADFDEATREEPILVAELQGELAGFVSWWPPDNFIHNLFVAPQFQRQGIGQLLLDACLQRLGRPATLKCVQQNHAALDFYLSLDWQIEACARRFTSLLLAAADFVAKIRLTIGVLRMAARAGHCLHDGR